MSFGSRDREVTSDSRRISNELTTKARNLASILGRSSSDIRRISLIGSAATEKAVADSDIDLICEISNGSSLQQAALANIARNNGYAPHGVGSGTRVDISVIEEGLFANPDDSRWNQPSDPRRLNAEQREFLANARRDQRVLYP